VHLVGFIIRIIQDARSFERQILKEGVCPPNDITSWSFLSKGVVFSAKEELKILYG